VFGRTDYLGRGGYGCCESLKVNEEAFQYVFCFCLVIVLPVPKNSKKNSKKKSEILFYDNLEM